MITRQVVLVLGAGASIPYGFPSGAKLTKTILDLLEGDTRFRKNVESCGFDLNMIENFRQEFWWSSQPSIDAFLEHRKEFIEIGKVCIAAALIPCENNNLIRDIDKNWYQYLFQKLNTMPDKFDQNKLSIITYNYDRSIEHFLFTALKHSYGLSDPDAAALVHTISIIHLHGDLGKLPVLDGSGRAYEPTITVSNLKQCAFDIKIISENVAGNPQFRDARHLIQQAEIICFLGFGFHPVNIDRLLDSPSLQLTNKSIYATTYEMPQSDQEAIRVKFRTAFNNQIVTLDTDALGGLHQRSILV